MKKIILASAMFVSLNATASFMQEECSNADATVRLSTGHVSNKVVFTVVSESQSSAVQVALMDLSRETLAKTDVENNHNSSCKPGDQHGIGFWDNISTVKVKITKKDGSSFPSGTAHASEDLKSVVTTLICHRHVNSMYPCKKE